MQILTVVTFFSFIFFLKSFNVNEERPLADSKSIYTKKLKLKNQIDQNKQILRKSCKNKELYNKALMNPYIIKMLQKSKLSKKDWELICKIVINECS